MKVTAAVLLLPLLAALSCCSASPMFGTGGMMKRRFPGTSDMTYYTYRKIADARKRAENPAAAPAPAPTPAATPSIATRSGGQQPVVHIEDDWMFDNEVGSPTTVHRHRGGSKPHYHEEDPDNKYYYRYPTSFNPRESYAYIQFPSYHSHSSVGVQQRRRRPSYQQIYMPKYY